MTTARERADYDHINAYLLSLPGRPARSTFGLKSILMKKVILLSDTEQLPEGAFEFASMLNEQEPILLTGVFLPRENLLDTALYYFAGAAAPVLYAADNDSVVATRQAIHQFEERCIRNGIEFRVHEHTFPDIKKGLKKETRFADLLLFSHEAFYENLDPDLFDEYSGDIMHDAECPVLIVPEHFDKLWNVILTYDGSAASVAAIKQFTNTLPEMTSLKAWLVYVDPNDKNDFPDRDYIQELAARHFKDLTLYRLDFSKKYFDTWMADMNHTILVAGAFNRSGLSLLLRKSFISNLLMEHHIPVFIAHH